MRHPKIKRGVDIHSEDAAIQLRHALAFRDGNKVAARQAVAGSGGNDQRVSIGDSINRSDRFCDNPAVADKSDLLVGNLDDKGVAVLGLKRDQARFAGSAFSENDVLQPRAVSDAAILHGDPVLQQRRAGLVLLEIDAAMQHRRQFPGGEAGLKQAVRHGSPEAEGKDGWVRLRLITLVEGGGQRALNRQGILLGRHLRKPGIH